MAVGNTTERTTAQCRKKDHSIIELTSEVDTLKADLIKKVEELAEEVAIAKADKAVWVRDYTIHQFLAPSPIFKWLEKYIPIDEEEEAAEGVTTSCHPCRAWLFIISP